MAGAGIKGAIRHALNGIWDKDLMRAIFGPDSGSSDLHAGAISFTDAQMVCFPVRCLKRTYVYATCPTALARLGRSVGETWQLPELKESQVVLTNEELLQNDLLILEALAYDRYPDPGEQAHTLLDKVGDWLAERALPPGFFAEKLKSDLVMVSDTDFTHFMKTSTLVEPHVRISDITGTAEKGGLFYTENLPPETLLLTLAMASRVRDGKTKMEAKEVIAKLSEVLKTEKLWQFGGDATLGRGLVTLRSVSNGAEK